MCLVLYNGQHCYSTTTTQNKTSDPHPVMVPKAVKIQGTEAQSQQIVTQHMHSTVDPDLSGGFSWQSHQMTSH